MSGEADVRPTLAAQIREIRDKVRDLESRISGDESGFDLSDLNDVRVDELVDPGISLVDGSQLSYRQSDNIWVPDNGGMLDFLQAFAAAPSGLANAVIEHLSWTVDGAHTSGTDISVVANVVTINTDGVYAVNCSCGAISDAAADTFNNYIALLDVEPNSGDRDAALMTESFYPGLDAGNKHYGNSALVWVGFLPAGAEFDVTLDMRGGGAGTWAVLYGFIQVDRIR